MQQKKNRNVAAFRAESLRRAMVKEEYFQSRVTSLLGGAHLPFYFILLRALRIGDRVTSDIY